MKELRKMLKNNRQIIDGTPQMSSGADEFRKANFPNNMDLARKNCRTHFRLSTLDS